MKKDDYLNILSQGLKQYDESYVQEILNDYEEHFQYALANGKSEEEICASLGNPQELINEIKEMMGASPQIQAPARPALDIEKTDSSSSNNTENRTPSNSSENRGFDKTTKPRYFDGNLNSNFNTGTNEDTNEAHTQNTYGTLKKIRFFADNADVRLIPSSDGEFHIYTEDGEEMDYLEHSYNNDTYEGRVTRSNAQASIALDILHQIFGSPVSDVILEIPLGIDDIRIEGYSGDLVAEGLVSEILSLSTISGDCKIKNSKNNGLFVSTKSGEIELYQVAAGHCELKTLSGDILSKELQAQNLVVNTVSGDVSGRRLDVHTSQIKTISGEISLKLLKNSETYYATAKTTSGRVKIRDGIRMDALDFQALPPEGNVKLALNTISGEISVKYSKNSGQS